MNKIKYLGVWLLCLVVGVSSVKALDVTSNLTLTEDMSEAIIVNGKTVTINLNGHSIIASVNGVIRAVDGANITITGTGTIRSNNSNAITIENGSSVTLESGTVRAQEFGVLVTNNSTFIMNGGTIETVDNCGVGGNGTNTDEYKNYTITINDGVINGNITSSGYISCGIYHPNKGTVNFNGGTINSSNGAGIVQRAGTLNITGGTINAVGSSTGKVGDAPKALTASALVVDKETGYPESATMVTRVSSDAVLVGAYKDIDTYGDGINIELTGGVYTEEPEEEQIPEGYSAYQVIEGENEDKYIVVSDDDVTEITSSGAISEESVDDDVMELIEETVKDKYTLVSFYDVSAYKVVIYDEEEDSYDLLEEGVQETSAPVEVTVGVPTDLPEVKTGFTRKYYIIRVHNGEVTIIDDVKDNGDGTLTFMSDKFSTYALAYTDVEKTVESPKTSDGITIYLFTILVSFVVLAFSSVALKKNN